MQREIARVLGLVRRTLLAHAMVRPGERVLVAVSGGPDSVALLALLVELSRRLGVGVVAAHVNHRLRGADADADERCAAGAAARLGVPFVRCALAEGLGAGGNLEARARRLRYAALHHLARESGCQKIATGHTQDDQAETVLARLIRGTGPAGLGGIQPRRADGVIRPLIDCRRTDVHGVLRALGLASRLDRSNEDPRFQRTRLRAELLPVLRQLNPEIVGCLARTATLARAEHQMLARWTAKRMERAARGGTLDLAALDRIPAALRGHVVRAWLAREGVAKERLGARHVEAVLRLADAPGASGSVRLPEGRRVHRRYAELVLGTSPRPGGFAPRALEPGQAVELPGGWRLSVGGVEGAGKATVLPDDLWSALCDAAPLSGPLTVRVPRRGERIRPLGLDGRRKLSDVFIDRKIPAGERWSHPVVEFDGQIVWVPGVVRGDALRVTPATRHTVRLRAERAARGA